MVCGQLRGSWSTRWFTVKYAVHGGLYGLVHGQPCGLWSVVGCTDRLMLWIQQQVASSVSEVKQVLEIHKVCMQKASIITKNLCVMNWSVTNLNLVPVSLPHCRIFEVRDERYGTTELVDTCTTDFQNLPVLVLHTETSSASSSSSSPPLS